MGTPSCSARSQTPQNLRSSKYSPLVCPLTSYDDLQQRTAVRAALAQDTARAALPGGGDLIVAQESEIMNPAPFMHPLGSRDYHRERV